MVTNVIPSAAIQMAIQKVIRPGRGQFTNLCDYTVAELDQIMTAYENVDVIYAGLRNNDPVVVEEHTALAALIADRHAHA